MPVRLYEQEQTIVSGHPQPAGAVFVTFVFTTLIHEPASIVTLVAIVALSIGLDYGWKRSRPSSPVPVQVVP